MAIPYNLLPIEVHWELIKAEGNNVPVLIDAARMWTEVREWIETARTELHTRVGELTPYWTDDAGREHEEKAQRILAELKMWADRLDAAQVPETLITLANAIPPVVQEVTALHAAYQSALSNPVTALLVAPGLQQLSGARMTALGSQFDMAMLKVAAGAGIQSPADLLGEIPAEGNSPADFIEAATAGVTVISELQNLASSISSGSAGVPDLSGVDGLDGSDGPSLAGLVPSPTTFDPASAASFGGGLSVGSPPVVGGSGWAGVVGGAGVTPLAKPVAGRRAPTLASEVRPGVVTPDVAKPAVGAIPPTMPSMAGQQPATTGTLRPGSGEQSSGRSGSGYRPAPGPHGVPVTLQGRAGKDDPTAFSQVRGQRPRETGYGSVQLLDD
ncbi:hypothetical protein ACWDV4_06530 [Micromonospora sp. NPDC003197]